MFLALGTEGVSKRRLGDRTIIEVDTDKATFWGTLVRHLGTFGRRKFENLLFLEHAPTRERVSFFYV